MNIKDIYLHAILDKMKSTSTQNAKLAEVVVVIAYKSRKYEKKSKESNKVCTDLVAVDPELFDCSIIVQCSSTVDICDKVEINDTTKLQDIIFQDDKFLMTTRSSFKILKFDTVLLPPNVLSRAKDRIDPEQCSPIKSLINGQDRIKLHVKVRQVSMFNKYMFKIFYEFLLFTYYYRSLIHSPSPYSMYCTLQVGEPSVKRLKFSDNESIARNVIVYDSTGSLPMTLWGQNAQHDFEPDTDVTISHVKVTSYLGQKQVQTTWATKLDVSVINYTCLF